MRGDQGTDPKDAPPAEGGALLAVENLRVSFGSGGSRVDAVRGVGFTLRARECLAVVGESGSGKSVTARALLGLAGPGSSVAAGRLELEGEDLTRAGDRRWRELRGRRIGMVLQDALSSLDPVRTVGAEIGETLRNHRTVPRQARQDRVVSLLKRVHVPDPGLRARQYPHQLSGGLRQRALIASAVAADPAVLIADEPTTALDVTVQAQILDLLTAMKAAGTAVLLISHDLSVVARFADRIAVMYQGAFVEEGPAEDVLGSPAHPYTRRLLAAVPGVRRRGARLAPSEPGGDLAGITTACGYAPRCPLAEARCREHVPPLVAIGPAHGARCWRTDDEEPAQTLDTAVTGRGRRDEAVIEVSGLTKAFRGPDRRHRPAVEGVSLTVHAGETLGVVGESGSGKSTLAALVMGLLEPDDGSVRFLGEPWSRVPEPSRRSRRGRIQLVHQDPLASFDPRYTVERIVGEALGSPGRRAVRRRRDQITELLHRVGLDPALLTRHPRELSGGQRQRVAIARALAPGPDAIVCDEPVSALDVSVQAQILDLFVDLRDELDVALLFISHDLGVIHHISDRVIVMREAVVVEAGPVEQIFRDPRHDYTRSLLAAVPRPEARTDTTPTH
ncbi:ABC transporter ATP-binding protein [Actinomadura litoris]|uniref:Dipeptide ABC transporter ATP-binding protein n=1 Tax=Actinomadura litoris TaxID=2678616 RepID=A0A7K1L4U9_9ACTN|nr:ABC transporter ATP-binding protein [Actinomadura litoris]MUN39464.1 dipeptide ABC transporter ATP-binding protein [Actinomadura litoris]